MPLPSNVITFVLTGRYPEVNGQSATGTVTFTPNVTPLTDVADPALLVGSATVRLVDGRFSVRLPTTDNASLSPSGWAWTVAEAIDGTVNRSPFLIQQAATSAASVDLATLAPVSPPPVAVSTNYGVLYRPNTWSALNNFTGGLAIGGITINTPPASSALFLAGDGVWRTPAGGGGVSTKVKFAYITSGDQTFSNNVAWTAYPAITIAIPAVVGDTVSLSVKAMWQKGTGDFIDWAVSTTSGGMVRFSSNNTGTPAVQGDPGWYPDTGFPRNGAMWTFKVQAGDVDNDGSVHFVLAHLGGTGGTFFSGTNYPAELTAINWGAQG